MYFYIYDSFLNEKKYIRFISKIETRLASLDIAGQKHQLSVLRSVDEIVERILQKETPTIIVIGGDKTFFQTTLPLAGKEATLGFIPTEQDSLVADLLGIPVNEYSCDVISARRIEEFSLGKINGQRFFSSVEFDGHKSLLTVDNKYQIIPHKIKTVKVANLDLLQFQNKNNNSENFFQSVSNPKDDYLEVLMGRPENSFWPIKRREQKDSLFFIKKIKVQAKKTDEEILIKVDKDKIIKTPALIEIEKEKVKIIVGRDRLI